MLSRTLGRARVATTTLRIKNASNLGARSLGIYTSHDSKEPYSKQMEKTGRPLSGHVDVYLKHNSFPLIAISSITNRASGVVLSAGIAGVGALSLAGADVPATMMAVSATAPFFWKFGVGFPLTYHYICGIRHGKFPGARKKRGKEGRKEGRTQGRTQGRNTEGEESPFSLPLLSAMNPLNL